jgi:hypothetical protein
MLLRLVHRANHGDTEQQELHVRVGCITWIEEVISSVVAHAPVEMFAGAIDARERLFVHQAGEAIFRRDTLEHLHRHHLVIGGDVGAFEDRRNFILAWRDFVVTRLYRHTDFVKLRLDVGHAGQDALGNRSEVLILELLPLRRARAEQGAAGVDQVGPREIKIPIDQEVFLFRAACRRHARRVRSEEPKNAHGLRGQRFHRSQQRRLLIERFAGPADERGGNHQRDAVAVAQQPRRAGRIPRRVAARFERAAHAAGGEARGIGLAFDEFLTAEFRNRSSVV